MKNSFVERATAIFEAYERQHYSPADPDTVKVGDHLSWYENKYQHRARVIVTKVNRRSIDAKEIPGSYQAGCEWRLHKDWTGWQHVVHDDSFDNVTLED